jgi:hypothetical protein
MDTRIFGIFGVFLLLFGALDSYGATPPVAGARCPSAYRLSNNQCITSPICQTGYYYPPGGPLCKSIYPTNHRSYAPSCPFPNMVQSGKSCSFKAKPGSGYPATCPQGGFIQSGKCTIVFNMTVNSFCPAPGTKSGGTCVAAKVK